ncbi:MAG: putative house-cleaning NTP pyrophosphatase (Maf/HAM1 superfamily) [Candidatus Endobugula sp.]|jgi:predicted house-cleaning NTP pyrophosphatase (Maf/HAM1 superfamily)
MGNTLCIYLASRSPRRRERLEQIGVEYPAWIVEVEEKRSKGGSPSEYVRAYRQIKQKQYIVEAGSSYFGYRHYCGAQ